MPNEINFGHFLKLVQEYFSSDNLETINFLLVGQKGTYKRLYDEDNSSERFLKHIHISKIDHDESLYILSYASQEADPNFEIEDAAKTIILKISAGFPYLIHLLGDAAFRHMNQKNKMALDDVLHGLREILKWDKTEKYISSLSDLKINDRIVIATFSNYASTELPMKIPIDWVEKNLVSKIEEEEFKDVLERLSEIGHIIINKKKGICQFNDELFRIYLSMKFIEAVENMPSKQETGTLVRNFSKKLKQLGVDDIVDIVEKTEFSKEWVHDQFDSLMGF